MQKIYRDTSDGHFYKRMIWDVKRTIWDAMAGYTRDVKWTIRDAMAGYTRDVKQTIWDAMVIHEMLNERSEMLWLYTRC